MPSAEDRLVTPRLVLRMKEKMIQDWGGSDRCAESWIMLYRKPAVGRSKVINM